jgi:hypothetical protein
VGRLRGIGGGVGLSALRGENLGRRPDRVHVRLLAGVLAVDHFVGERPHVILALVLILLQDQIQYELDVLDIFGIEARELQLGLLGRILSIGDDQVLQQPLQLLARLG